MGQFLNIPVKLYSSCFLRSFKSRQHNIFRDQNNIISYFFLVSLKIVFQVVCIIVTEYVSILDTHL